MNALVVFAHPSRDSFTGQVLERFLAGLRDAGHEAVVADLYAEGFDPVMRPAEYARESRTQVDAAVPDDVARELARLAAADAVAFVFPLWWSDCPAILKGWFDRVYAVGHAYDHREGARAGFGIARGLVLCTAGNTEEQLRETGVVASLEAVMLHDRMVNVGIGDPALVLLAGTAGRTDPGHFERLRARAYEAGRALAGR